jgi:hypothetical protein
MKHQSLSSVPSLPTTALRVNLIPRLMFAGHSPQLMRLLPKRKPTIRMKADERSHIHVSKAYEELYDLSPNKKKEKLRTARLSHRTLITHRSSSTSRCSLFPTEISRQSSLKPAFRLTVSRASQRCEEVMQRAGSLLVLEKENTQRVINDLDKRGRGAGSPGVRESGRVSARLSRCEAGKSIL